MKKNIFLSLLAIAAIGMAHSQVLTTKKPVQKNVILKPTPSQSSPPPPAPSVVNPSSTTQQVSIANTQGISRLIKKPTAIDGSSTLIGYWMGTQISTENRALRNFGFELTSSKEFFIKNAADNFAAKGTHSLINNVFSGSYKLLSTGYTMSFTGTYVSNTKQLTFTQGLNGSVINQEKIVATKH